MDMEPSREVRRLRAVITGGATSIGLAIARMLLRDGYIVAVCDVDAQQVEAALAQNPGLLGEPVDMLVPTAVETFFRRLDTQIGGVDFLVNTVGVPGPHGPIESVEVGEWEATIRGSVGAAFFAIRQVVPGMKSRRYGSIVNFSSASTKTGLPLRTPYVAAKYAVEGLTRNLARELGPYNIRVNAVLPGAIDNARLVGIIARNAAERGIPPDRYEEYLLGYVSMRTKISLDELAEAVAFLGSDRAPHITGQLIAVDGNLEWEG